MVYRPRILKRVKTEVNPAVLRYFCAPVNTTDDFYAMSAECDAARRNDQATELLFDLYYDPLAWKQIWRDHCGEIEAEWKKRIRPEDMARHREWALQSYSDRLNQHFREVVAKEEV